MTKIKILILNEPEGLNGVTYWRMYEPMKMLEAMYGDQVEIIWNRGMLLPIDIERADVAIAWRPSTPAQLSVIAQVKESGIKIIADHDDDLLNVPSGSPAFNAYFQSGNDISKILSLCDMVWTSTEQLKKVYNHPNSHVVPNAILPEMIAANPNPITKTVMWRGDYNQVEDLYAGKETYFNITKKCNYFLWCGYMPTWKHPEHAKYVPWNSLGGYFKFIRSIGPNFIWKFMRKEVIFSHGKSNISKIEAIVCGAVPLTNFYDMPTWEHSFREISWKESEVFGAWEAGRDDVVKNYNLEAWTHTRYRLIASLVGL